MDRYVEQNRKAWDGEVKKQNRWTVPVSSMELEEARKGAVSLYLTPDTPVPAPWLGDVRNRNVLCLASGGGQQGPLLSAMGATVTVFDNSPAQLEQDKRVAELENLSIRTVQGDMRDLSAFPSDSFDMIVHPVSNCFIDDVLPVWKECNRVLKKGGYLLAGVTNPVMYLFDEKAEEKGKLKVKYTIPFSDLTSISRKEFEKRVKQGDTIEFSHTLDAQIGGLCRSGFTITGFYSDTSSFELTDSYIHDCYLAIRARKETSL